MTSWLPDDDLGLGDRRFLRVPARDQIGLVRMTVVILLATVGGWLIDLAYRLDTGRWP